jgi:sigma-B regulation protein RsbU (phosphoserine phosphatase)
VPETDNGSALRPVDWSQFDGVDICAKHHAKCLGGDFFDGLALGDRILFLLTDIAGPRTEASRVAAAVQTVFREKATELFTPSGADGSEVNESDAMAELANAVNRSLIDAAGGRTHLAPTFIGCFLQSLGILTYCNAGNVFALAREGQAVRPLESSGMPLGLFSHLTFEAMILALHRGEALLLVTKGVAESRSRGEEFGATRLARMFEHSSDKSAAAICDEILQEAYDFGTRPWERVLDYVNAGDFHRREDLTALALVRRA